MAVYLLSFLLTAVNESLLHGNCRRGAGVWCSCSQQAAAACHGQHHQVRAGHSAYHSCTTLHGDDNSRQAPLTSLAACVTDKDPLMQVMCWRHWWLASRLAIMSTQFPYVVVQLHSADGSLQCSCLWLECCIAHLLPQMSCKIIICSVAAGQLAPGMLPCAHNSGAQNPLLHLL